MGNARIQRTESGKKMKKAVCVLCRLRHYEFDMHFHDGKIGICDECFSSLQRTLSTRSFAAIKTAEYIISPFYYKDKLRNSILSFKFRSCHAYGAVYARLMYEELKDLEHLRDFDMVIPVPLSQKRMMERGYNQAALIAKPFAAFFEVDYCDDVLERIRNTKRQSGLIGEARVNNVLGAFSSTDVTGKRILLLDDIHTTGCTIEECAKTLKSSGAKEVVGITLAIIDKPKRTVLF